MTQSTISTNQASRFKLTVSGTEFTQEKPEGLDMFIVEDHVDMLGLAQVTLNLECAAWDSFHIGDVVEAGLGGDDKPLFNGFITGFRHVRQKGKETLTVLAMDPLCKMAASRKTRTFEGKSDSEIVRKIIDGAGLTAGTVDDTAGAGDWVTQRNESDLEFAKRLAARNGYLLRAREGKIDFVKTQFGGGSTIEIEENTLETLDYSFSVARLPPKITTYGWDYVAKQMVEGSASSITPIGSGKSAIDEANRIWQGDSFISDVRVSSQDGATSIAKGELERLARNFLRGRAVVDGNGKIRAGAQVSFKGSRPGFNPEAYVVSSRHVVESKRASSTEFFFCSNTFPK